MKINIDIAIKEYHTFAPLDSSIHYTHKHIMRMRMKMKMRMRIKIRMIATLKVPSRKIFFLKKVVILVVYISEIYLKKKEKLIFRNFLCFFWSLKPCTCNFVGPRLHCSTTPQGKS